MRSFFGKSAVVAAAVAAVGAASIATAQAACTQSQLTGTWYSGVAAEFGKGGGWAGVCTYTIKSNGTYTGPCTSQGTGESAPTTDKSGHGTIKVNSKCEISGVMSATGLHDTKITSGILHGDVMFISGARDKPATQVRLLTMIRK